MHSSATPRANKHALDLAEKADWAKLNLVGTVGIIDIPDDSVDNLHRVRVMRISDTTPVDQIWTRRLTGVQELEIIGGNSKFATQWLELFPDLQRLSISSGDLQEVPDIISEISSLTDLSLQFCDIRTIPSWISRLQELQRLDFTSLPLRSIPDEVANLGNLKTIKIANTRIAYIPECIRQLPLREFNANQSHIRDIPDWIYEFTELRRLELAGMVDEALSERIGALSALEVLDVSNSALQSIPDNLSTLSCLRELNIANRNLSSTGIQLAGLRNLRVLNLSLIQLKELPKEIRSMQYIENLILSNTGLEDLPEWLDELRSLRVLGLAYNKFGEIPGGVFRLTQLRSLDLSGNRLIRRLEIGAATPPLEDLEYLSLANCSVTQIPSELVTAMPALERLDLDGNELTEFPLAIFEWKHIREAKLSKNHISDLPPDFNFGSLEVVDLSNNEIAALPETMEGPELLKIDISGNRIQSLPDGLFKLHGLITLNLRSNAIREIPGSICDLQNLESLTLAGNSLTSLPDELSCLTNLSELSLGSNKIQEIPASIANLYSLQSLEFAYNEVVDLPPELGNLVRLTQLIMSNNQISVLPLSLANLDSLGILAVTDNPLGKFPEAIVEMTGLLELDLTRCALPILPEEIGAMRSLVDLNLSYNPLTTLPDSIGDLAFLSSLSLMDTKLLTLPQSMSRLKHLGNLDLDGIGIETIPDVIFEIDSLQSLDLRNNRLKVIPAEIQKLGRLNQLWIQFNEICMLPPEIGGLRQLQAIGLEDNPLPPEIMAASEAGSSELMALLQAIHEDGELVTECKMVIVGEGEVGKSSLLAAMRNEAFVSGRETTHGIEIKPVVVASEGREIAFNAWDFGGQQIYRPTHQLFFTAPAVYIVVWKPREGPELGLVEHWLTMIRHRAGFGARVHVVATHGGPGERYAHIDEFALRQRFGAMISGFHHVDSRTRDGIDDLLADLAATALSLDHVSRWYPAGWLRLRRAIQSLPEAYRKYDHFEELATDFGLGSTAAASMARNSHALGYWIFYSDEPGLSELVIFKPDWLSVAVGLVLEDAATIADGGMLPHRRLPEIWNNPDRPPTLRYSLQMQQMFLRLMERFELTYRVPETVGGEPLSLMAQLVSNSEPDLSEAWTSYRQSDPELLQLCRVVEREGGRLAFPEGLMHRLIVLFHRHSLGRFDIGSATHWSGGIVLQDRYGARALVRRTPDGISIHVRGLNPQAFLDKLVLDIREFVEAFWMGLRSRVLIPCRNDCGLDSPGRGLFDLDKLYRRLEKGSTTCECPDPDCDAEVMVSDLLSGSRALSSSSEARLDHLVRDALSGVLDIEGRRLIEAQTTRLLDSQAATSAKIMERIETLDDDTRAAFSRADERVSVILRGLNDDGADGPRLFTLEPIDRSIVRPGLTTQHMRLTLWCEHSRLPVSVLEPGRPDAGVYEVKVPRDWWLKAAPVLKATRVVLGAVLPVSLAALELDLDDEQWGAVKEQLALDKELAGVASKAIDAGTDSVGSEAVTHVTSEEPTRAEGGLLRMLHLTLREQDITFADLRRVMNDRGQYLWVHERFVSEYQPLPPVIPT